MAIAATIAIIVAMAPTLALPKGFKFCRIFSRVDPNATSTSQVPPVDIVVPTLEGSVQPTTPIGESSDKKKSYENNCQFQFLWLPLFLWVEPICKDEEPTKVICKVSSKFYGKSIVLVAKNDNLWKHLGRKIAKSVGHGWQLGKNTLTTTQPTIKMRDFSQPYTHIAFKRKWVSPRLKLGRRSGFNLAPFCT